MKRILMIVLVWLLAFAGYGQEVKRLHIGDTMPPVVFSMLNYKDSVLNLGDVKKKLIILSFWTPSCSFSSGQLPVLYRLQQQFPTDLCIVPVGFDGREEGAVRRFVETKAGTAEEVRVPTALQPFRDQPLYQMLPFMGLPQYVWLDSNLIIRAITDHFSLTREHIAEMIAGKAIAFDLKDFDTSFDEHQPLLVNGNGGADNDFSYRSLITPYKPFVSFPQVEEHTDAYTRIAAGNATPAMLLLTAIKGCDSTRRLPAYDPMLKRLINAVKGNEIFDTPYYDLPPSEYGKAEQLRKKQLFCYELVCPPAFTYPHAYRKMLSDLCDFFHVAASIEKQAVPAIFIVKTGNVKQEKRMEEEQIYVSQDRLSFSFQHCTLQRIADVLNNVAQMPIVKDNTLITGTVSLSFHLSSLTDVAGLEKSLHDYGFGLEKKTVPLDMFVIRNR